MSSVSERTLRPDLLEAVAEFEKHESRSDAAAVVDRLLGGLRLLRNTLFQRLLVDVEQHLGTDSMLMPVSPAKVEGQTKTEIEIFQVMEAAECARQRRYVSTSDDWFRNWLARLRLGTLSNSSGVRQRMEYYVGHDADARRLMFEKLLDRVLPEARRAPLVVMSLFPLGVSIATSLAFGDHESAAACRKRQLAILPSIGYCHACHGGLLENGETCVTCGNPLWQYEWLTAD